MKRSKFTFNHGLMLAVIAGFAAAVFLIAPTAAKAGLTGITIGSGDTIGGDPTTLSDNSPIGDFLAAYGGDDQEELEELEEELLEAQEDNESLLDAYNHFVNDDDDDDDDDDYDDDDDDDDDGDDDDDDDDDDGDDEGDDGDDD